MALPTTWASDWFDGLWRPFGTLDSAFDDYRVYEEDGDVVVTFELPGYDTDEIDVRWDDGVLQVSAAHSDEDLGRERAHHRRVRLGREVADEDVSATYHNGILEVTLPLADDATPTGREIPIEDGSAPELEATASEE